MQSPVKGIKAMKKFCKQVLKVTCEQGHLKGKMSGYKKKQTETNTSDSGIDPGI